MHRQDVWLPCAPPELLAKSLDGHIPLLELDDGPRLPESAAILFDLADGTLPAERSPKKADPLGRAPQLP